MTDIMKLADEYAVAQGDARADLGANAGMDEQDLMWVAMKEARATLQSTIEALQAKLDAIQKQEPVELEDEMLDAAFSWCDANSINVLEPEQLSSLVNSLYIAVRDAAPKALEPLPAGLERCEFDDECDYCSSPEQGTYTRLTHNAEDCTEAEFYVCGACLAGAIPPRAAPKALEALTWQPIETAPKDGRKVIVTYANRNGLKRTVMACWLTDEAAAETDADDVGLEAGWYESIDNWSDYTEVAIHEGEPTHWMPLPDAPAHEIGSQQ